MTDSSANRYCVIANPAAHAGAAARAIPDVERMLAQHGLHYDLVVTTRPGQAADLAWQAAIDGYDVVVAAGGDGTANEVLNGLMTAKLAGKGLPRWASSASGAAMTSATGWASPASWRRRAACL